MINEKLTEVFCRFIHDTSVSLPPDILNALRRNAEYEDGRLQRELYGCIFENLKKAGELDRPVCQDTGALQFFLRAGARFPYLGDVEASIREAVKISTKRIPLRPNVIESFDERNTGDNTGTRAPWIEWEIEPDSACLTAEVYMAGGGCSLPGRAKTLMPLEGYEGMIKFVFDTVTEWGINACPPLLIGVGIGTCAPTAAMLSKRALLRPVGSRNKNPKVSGLEEKMAAGLDSIGIGPLGLTGKRSVLGVHIEYAGHHPAALGVGVSFGCWATRRGKVLIDGNLNVIKASDVF